MGRRPSTTDRRTASFYIDSTIPKGLADWEWNPELNAARLRVPKVVEMLLLDLLAGRIRVNAEGQLTYPHDPVTSEPHDVEPSVPPPPAPRAVATPRPPVKAAPPAPLPNTDTSNDSPLLPPETPRQVNLRRLNYTRWLLAEVYGRHADAAKLTDAVLDHKSTTLALPDIKFSANWDPDGPTGPALKERARRAVELGYLTQWEEQYLPVLLDIAEATAGT